MKKRQEFLFSFICLCFMSLGFDYVKLLVENGVLSKWGFVLIALLVLVIGWMAVYAGAKSLKNKKMESWKSWILGFIYFISIWSVFMTFDVMKFSLENNMLNKYYFFGIGIVFMFIGWAEGRLDKILPKPKNKRN